MVKVHKLTMDLFRTISDDDKRSLASKYLHFHVPELFYILDSRAEKAIGSFVGRIRLVDRPTTSGDLKYGNFVAKCALLKSRCEAEFGVRLSPRKLDSLLLTFGLIYLHQMPRAPAIAANKAYHQNNRGRVAFIDRR